MDLIDYIRGNLPPSVVSLWVPSGQNRAIDLIRGNHGQCYGTHPNVPVLPSLINPSVGWHFDGINDWIKFYSPIIGIDPFSVFAWVYLSAIPISINCQIISNYNAAYKGFRFYIDSNRKVVFGVGRQSDTSTGDIFSSKLLNLETWHFVGGIYDGVRPFAMLDCELTEGVLYSPIEAETANIRIGKHYNETYFRGNIALPFPANKAWSQQQVENFYLATKGLFAPRG